VNNLYDTYERMRKELAGVIVGMDNVTEQLMIGILCRSHCILQGMPGLAKTLLISQLASLMDLTFHRIQFTPDLMPGDITGGDVLEEDHTTGKRAPFCRVRCLPTWCWRTKSTARRPRPKARSWRRWKSGSSP
jgi:MoxR-like ATPase